MASNYPPNYPPNYSPNMPPPNIPAKKRSPWLWVLAGCATLLLIAVVAVAGISFFVYHKAKQAGLDPELMRKNPALASAKIAVTMNPDLELVSVDEEKGTLTIKDKKSGKTVTVNTEDIENGKITFTGENNENVSLNTDTESGTYEIKTDKETVRFGAGASATVPDWVPAYPGATVRNTAAMESGQASIGSFQFTTSDPVEKVLSFYEQQLENKNFKMTLSSAKQSGEVSSGTAFGKDAGDQRSVSVVATKGESGTDVTVSFQTKK